MLQLIMLTGLQGTGKSTIARYLAQKLHYSLFAKDHFETILYNDQLTDGTSISSYHMILETADLHLGLGLSCILDAVFPLTGFRNRVQQITQTHQAQLKIIHTFCSKEEIHRQLIENRLSTVPWARITWDDMLHTKSKYDTWLSHEALFLDVINPIETNVEKALQYIGNRP